MAQTSYNLGPINTPGYDSHFATHTKHISNLADHETRVSTAEGKLAGIATGATANATDANLRDRSTHTGTQTASTISDFTEAAQDVIGAMVVAAGGTYNDAGNSITLPAGGGAY